MARLRLTLHNFNCFEKVGSTFTKVAQNVLLSTDKESTTLYLSVGDSSDTKLQYDLNIVTFGFQKKMYQPTEITADIQIALASGNDNTWKSIGRKQIETLFKHLQVSLDEVPAKDTSKTDDENLTAAALNTIGDDFYVYEVLPHYQSEGMYVTLKISSLDKLLTLRVASRAFTAKRLSAILKSELEKYNVSYKYTLKSNDGKDGETTMTQKLQSDLTKMKQLGVSGKDHIFPYLVQYNETFYDMLARTCNRWGEFLYYEDNALHVGYDSDDSNVKALNGFNDIHYFDSGKITPTISNDGFCDLKSSNEKQFVENVLKKSPNEVSGNLFYPTTAKWDKVLMKEISSFLKNDKNVPTWLSNRLLDNTVDLVKKALEVSDSNSEFDDQWFPGSKKPGADDQYKDGKEFNQFTEYGTKFKDGKYKEILAAEEVAGKNAIHVDFSTTCPGLKLGNIIEYNDEKFIVVEINCRKETKMKYSIGKDIKGKDIIVETPNSALLFDVVATACKDDKTNLFYPAVIPAGHFRLADPQIATIVDDGDPSGNNQVRVVFPWQQKPDDKSENEKKDSDSAGDDPTPWLQFATSAAGSPTIGKHYAGDEVLVGFVGGNVECPYVLGVLASKGDDADYIQTTPGGHKFKLQDDEDGIKNFLTGMFLPCVETIGSVLTYFPGVKSITDAMCKPAQGDKNNLSLGGGFELSDNYGIYKISGSTDGREVAIASPWGEVNINAFTGITISAPNGDVAIKGKNIKLEAGNNIEIISGTNVKNKILGGDGSGFGADMATAVAKKVANTLTSIVDLSTVRAAIEIVFRPAEGALRIKSNRFLMLEAGKGKCTYPKSAYADEETYKENFEELKKEDFRKGLKLVSGVEQILAQISTIGSMHNTRFMNAYNKCVEKQLAYSSLIKQKNVIKWGEKYDRTKPETHKICHKYEDAALKDKLWADGNNLLTDADLGFVSEYDLDISKVTNRNVETFSNGHRMNVDIAKKGVLGKRKAKRADILKVANELRQAIIDFKKLPEITEQDVKTSFKTVRDKNLPKNAEKCLITAFTKTNLGDDVFYYKPMTDDQKKLNTKYTEATLKTHMVVLERKAAILAIEALGFKDEWREQKDNPNFGVAGQPTKDLKKIPKVERKFGADDLKDNNYWENYVKTIIAVPKLNAVEYKAYEEFKKNALDNLGDLKFWESWQENDSWSDAKNGGILFSSDSRIYDLKKNIEDVPSPFKENLTMDDNTNDDVKTMLDKVKAKLNAIVI